MTFSLIISAQRHDNIWITGYNGQNPWPTLGATFYNFIEQPPEIYREVIDLNFARTNASICNKEGDLLFYTNGGYIFNANHELMENGDSLSTGEYADQFADWGFEVTQGILILPVPGRDSLFMVFHNRPYPNGVAPYSYDLLLTEVNINLNNQSGEVFNKNEILIDNIVVHGKITATKHANGRDWWIMTYEKYNDIYHKLLLTPNGIEQITTQDMDMEYFDDVLGMARFTPNGDKYIKYDLRLLPTGNTLDIYDFDRCTGELSNNVHISLGDTTGISGGIAISPNSRFLYATTRNRVYQLDLLADDIEASKLIVAEFDGFQSEYTTTYFNQPTLAPDGKIYITLPGTDMFLHRINLPNLHGADCEVVQRAVNLPTFMARAFPNFPNYRLGPLDDSPCDTLGIDNHPLAGFTWETDSLTAIFSDNTAYEPTTWMWDFDGLGMDTVVNPTFNFPSEGNYNVCQMVSNEYDSDTLCQEVLVSFLQADFEWSAEELVVNFTDISISEPFDWFWEFGDEATSTEQHPVHNYAAPGFYEVCLTVMDEWAEVRVCDSVEVDVIDGVSSIMEATAIVLYPNPATQKTTIMLSDILPTGHQLLISNIAGQLVETIDVKNERTYQLDLGHYRSGVYWVRVIGEHQQVFRTEKLVVVK